MHCRADDLSLVVNAGPRAELQVRAVECVGFVEGWSAYAKLLVAHEKSKYLLILKEVEFAVNTHFEEYDGSHHEQGTY